MPSSPAVRPFEVRHLQLARAVIAAIAAAMITFTADHSALLGLSVFSGFAIANALVLFLSAWLVFPAGARGPVVLLGALSVVAGMAAGVQPLRSDGLFFGLVAAWAVATGVAEAVQGLRARRAAKDAAADPAQARGADLAQARGADLAQARSADLAQARSADLAQARSEARDAVVVGVLGVILAVALLAVPAGYALNYTVAEAHQTFTLTGITIGVGIFGGYAAIVAVYLGIAGFSPRRADADTPRADSVRADEHSGGAA